MGSEALVPLGVMSAGRDVRRPVTRASWASRPKWLEPLDWERVLRVLLRRHAAPPVVKDLHQRGALHLEQTVNSSEFDKANGRIPPQPDGKTQAWGVNSSARLLAHGGVFSEDAAQQAGYCMPSAEVLKTSLHLGARESSLDHDAVVSVPGEARGVTDTFAGPNGAAPGGSPFVDNTAALRAMFESLFGACSEDPVALDRLVESAMRYADPYAPEFGFARRSPRATYRRPRASPYAGDFPKCASTPAWHVYSAASRTFAPDHLAVEPYRLPEGCVDLADFVWRVVLR